MKTKRKIPLIAWAGIGLVLWGVIRSWRPGWFGRALSAQETANLRAMPSTNFRVTLNDGSTVILNNLQLADQINKSNVKSYVRLTSGAVAIPPNQRWRVLLRDGRQEQMTSAQLQSAVNAGAVKSYSKIATTA